MNIQYISTDYIMNFGMGLFFVVFSLLITILIIAIKAVFTKKKYKSFEPPISIIIPAYNEEATIKDCITAVLKSKYNRKKLEIICVDDGSTDKTSDIVKKLIKTNSNLRLVKGRHRGKPHALNLGVAKSKHEYIISLDADTILDRNFIKEIIRPFSDKKVGATNGIALIKDPNKFIEHFQIIEYYLNNLIRESFSSVFSNGIWFFGAAACFKKSILKKAGLFDNSVLTEDMEISLKIFELGYHVLTVKDARYHTRACASIRELFAQRMRWFYGGLQCTFKHKKLFRRKSFAIKYLFFNQVFWSVYSIIVIPIVIYQVNFWLPDASLEIAVYVFRWFSFAGPVYVLYKMPDWGLSLINIFGVMAGIISVGLILMAIKSFNGKLNLSKILVIFFYFPYTLLLNAILTTAIIKYSFSKKKYFIK